MVVRMKLPMLFLYTFFESSCRAIFAVSIGAMVTPAQHNNDRCKRMKHGGGQRRRHYHRHHYKVLTSGFARIQRARSFVTQSITTVRA